ncbi:hypothetical protein L2E82_23083 [Cichorium intybus]|uniref:Uncharacterized protein n=1 Tax=Cichorium intybus TaxID=13427 RepID=A0ACB9DZV3_CICIN|nr:hypothetical protein L2E82_23083 [Cichorium intybus]
MMEARHQQYEKESREREAKVFKLLESQQQWISGVSDRMTQLTSLMSMMANNFVPGFKQMASRVQEEEELDQEGLVSSAEYISRRDALIGRRVLEATVIDRDILRGAGLWSEIEPFLHRTWTHGEASFTCRAWDKIMAIEEDVVYTELLLEFLSTIHFAPRASDPRSRIVRFRLGGAQRECNLQEFGRRVGLYTPADLQHRPFTQFLGACIQGQPERPGNMEVWAPLSNVIYEAGTSRESQLRDPLHLLMHRIVSTSIMHREGGEKVSGDDMTYFWVLLDASRFLHLPFALAVALSAHSTGASASSPLARGAVHPGTDRATPDPQPGRRRQRQEAPAEPAPQPQQEDPTAIHRLAARVARIEDQLEWIGEVLLQIASAQGQHPRPFPARAHDHEARPSRPPGGD